MDTTLIDDMIMEDITGPKKIVIITTKPQDIEPPKGGCIIVVRGSIYKETSIRYPCQFCSEKYHYHGFYEGCKTPTYRTSQCSKLPKGTEVLIHF